MTKIVLALLSGMAVVSCTAASAQVQPGSDTARSHQSVASPSGNGKSHKKEKQLKANAPPWERYLYAGIDFEKKGDLTRAKEYYLYSLSLLEKIPPKKGQLTGSVARLEGHIAKIYRTPNTDAKPANKIRLDEEQIAVLSRLERLNQVYKGYDNLVDTLVRDQQQTAIADLKQNKASLKPQ